MTPKVMLARWEAIEHGDGIQQARRIARYLSLAALAIFMAAVIVGTFFELPTWATLVPGVAVGWLLAERNSLESRVAQWPAFRRYIDWSLVNADLHGTTGG